MKKLILILALGCGFGPLATAGPPAVELADAVARWNEALRRGSLDELMRLYAKDAMVLLPDGKAARDPEGIRRFWSHLLAKRGSRYELDLDDVIYAKDDTVVSTLRWSSLDGGLRYAYDGLIYIVFRRQPDGSWKTQVQRWN